MSSWYRHILGESVGPASTDDVIASLRSGDTRPDTLVCRVGETNWQTLSLVPEFAEAVREVAPPPVYRTPHAVVPRAEPDATRDTSPQPQGGFAPPHCGFAPPQGGFAPPQGGFAHPPQPQYVYVAQPPAQKQRVVFILLGLFLGPLGIHNFYAGYALRGVVQLLITLFGAWFCVPLVLVWIWNVLEMIIVTRDSDNVPFS